MKISSETETPVLFDVFHHEIHNHKETIAEVFELFHSTWKASDGLPMVDYSTPKIGEPKGRHAESIELQHFRRFLAETRPFDSDIMLEIRNKEKSALEAIKIAFKDQRFRGKHIEDKKSVKAHRQTSKTHHKIITQKVSVLAVLRLPRMNKDEIKKAIKGQFLCRIAFKGNDYPYIAPFQYIFMNETLYFHFTAYGRKMELIEKEKKVCVEVEQYKPDLSQYMFVTLKGNLSIVRDPTERAEVIKRMREIGKERLSRNFLAAHGFNVDEGWSSLTAEKPLVIVKLEKPVEESGLKSPYYTLA